MPFLTDLRHRLESLLFWNRRARELREELDLHVRMEVEYLERHGINPAEARHRAYLKFGGVDRTIAEVQDASGASLLHETALDMARALRGFGREPTYWLSLCLTLAIGIALTTLVFAFADAYLLRSLPYPDGDRLVAVYDAHQQGVRSAASLPEFLQWREELTQVDALVSYMRGSATWMSASARASVHVMQSSRGYMKLLGIDIIAGRDFAPADHEVGAPPVVLVSETLWRTRMGRARDAIGSSITLDDARFVVIGIARNGRDIADPAVDVWMPLETHVEWRAAEAHFLPVIGRLAPHASAQSANIEMQRDAKLRASALPLRDALADNAGGPMRLLFVGALCVLLVTLSNAAGLVHARSAARSADFAVRRALGAGSMRLARQAAAEFFAVGIIAAVASATIATVGIRVVRNAWVQKYDNVLRPGIDHRTAFFLFMVVLVAMLAMSLPVLWRIRSPARSIGIATNRVLGTRQRGWMLLVGAQVALTTVLLTGAGLSTRSLVRLLRVDPGYDAHGVYTAVVVLPRDLYATASAQLEAFDALLRSLRASNGATASGGAVNLPLSGGTMTSTFDIEGATRSDADRDQVMAEQHIITPGYLRTMKMHLLAGRDLTADDRTGADRVILVNESMAKKYWPNTSAIGHRIRIVGSGFQRIVGVVADTHLDGLDHATRLETYTPFAQAPLFYMSVVVRMTGGARRAQATLEDAVTSLDPHIEKPDVKPVQSFIDKSTQSRRIPATAFDAFSAVSLILAAVGVFGLQAYAVAQRRREIGLRIALGASRLAILRMIARVSLLVIGTGIALGLILSVAGGRLVASYLFGVTAYDGVTYIGVLVVIFAAGAVATAIPAYRAAAVSPLEALQSE